MRLACWILFALLLAGIFGCIGGGGGQNVTVQDNVSQNATQNQTQKPPVQIIIGQQKNQTTGQNVTPQKPPEPNKTGELDYTEDPSQQFAIFFIDVGGPALHGDAILLKKGDVDILIDAGPAEKASKVVDFLRVRGTDDVEILVSTAADPRRYGGMGAVADNYRIETFWWGGNAFGDPAYEGLVARMNNQSRVKLVEEGFAMEINGINLTALNPPKSATDKFDDVNNDAIVLKAVDRDFSILFTSGIQTGAQGRLITRREQDIKVPIIQAPYYGVGAGTSNIGIFLIKTQPEIMVVTGSADETPANGGSREPFERLMTQYGIDWYESYVNGTLRISSNGKTYDILGMGKGHD